uniref:Wsv023-like protein n=1 Tax=Hemigrapsus takanoi nimavirus TaxID=2133792 RepID=A0A401IP08_9VIRU|nr:MAG: wsv023-like protein [Hemigrapsus takanoi nimavirus]GBG35330.1 wsv023-like protein [Hemigrapsus takanoi nimavirus]
METPRQDSARAMDVEDEAIQVQLSKIFAAIIEILPVCDPSHSDLVDNSKMNRAATDSNRKHLQRKQQQQQDQQDSLKKNDIVRRIDTTTSQVVATDLETLKGHSQEVGDVLTQFMQFAEGDGEHSQGGGDNKKRTPVDENKRKMDVLSTVCSNTMIDRPFVKLSLFSDIIKIRGMPLEKLSQYMTAPKGDNKVLKMMPSLINTSMDIMIKLCCTWMFFSASINLKKLSDEEKDGDYLLDLSDPCVLNAITWINNAIETRRNSSLTTLLPGETTLQKKIDNRSVMIENLSEIIIPCLIKMESVLSV